MYIFTGSYQGRRVE